MNSQQIRLRIALLSLPMIIALYATGTAQDVNSISQYLPNGSFHWRIFIQADKATLSSITSVEYRLDPSFTKPVRKVDSLGDAAYPFAVSGEAQKTFTTGVTIYFRDRKPKYLEYTVRPAREIAVTQQVRIRQNTSKVLDQNPFQKQVAIYVSNGTAKRFRLKIYENFGSEKAFFEAEMYSDQVNANFSYNGQPYILRGYTKGIAANFDLYCTVYRLVLR